MKFRYKLISAVSAAAVLLVAFAVIALAGREMSAPKPDTLAAPELNTMQNSPTAVPAYESEEDIPVWEGWVIMPETVPESEQREFIPENKQVMDEEPWPTAMPTEEPLYDAEEWSTTPRPTPEPTYTPAPKAMATVIPVDSESGAPRGVYCTQGGVYYHTDEHCSGMMNAGFCGIETAAYFSKVPCPVCCNFDMYVYYTEKGNYYHAYKQCSGMQGAEAHKISEGVMLEKIPCPACIPELVYAELFGTLYHIEEECSGMMNAREMGGYIALQAGKAPCPVCIEPNIRP